MKLFAHALFLFVIWLRFSRMTKVKHTDQIEMETS